jgi:hypothetical protein
MDFASAYRTALLQRAQHVVSALWVVAFYPESSKGSHDIKPAVFGGFSR